MKHLVIHTHPNPRSFNHAIKDAFIDELKSNGHEVRLRDLYAIGLDPVLRASDFEAIMGGLVPDDVKTEQDHIRWADIITFIHPIWWSGLPALLKGYIDRVFSLGFAYSMDGHALKGLLHDKKVLILNTTGADRQTYEQSGMLAGITKTIDDGIYRFCAMEVIGHKYLYAVCCVTQEERLTMLAEVRAIAKTVSEK
ncbi:MAG: NAD(P)H-dependent oxidoreductase [Nitrospirae bacterium]|nr:NAD(P)H-dependent oxidoreductase [Nitrospirota bacterium]